MQPLAAHLQRRLQAPSQRRVQRRRLVLRRLLGGARAVQLPGRIPTVLSLLLPQRAPRPHGPCWQTGAPRHRRIEPETSWQLEKGSKGMQARPSSSKDTAVDRFCSPRHSTSNRPHSPSAPNGSASTSASPAPPPRRSVTMVPCHHLPPLGASGLSSSVQNICRRGEPQQDEKEHQLCLAWLSLSVFLAHQNCAQNRLRRCTFPPTWHCCPTAQL